MSILVMLSTVGMGQNATFKHSVLSPSTAVLLDPELASRMYVLVDGKILALAWVAEDFQAPEGVRIEREFDWSIGRGVTLSIEPFALSALVQHPKLKYIDAASRINSPRPLNDTSRILSDVDRAHQGLQNDLSQDYTGKGVLVGIVDIGFQTDHPTFYNEDGSRYRVCRFWNQSVAGTPPQGFFYGAEFKDSSSIVSNIDPWHSHGTHVAGIAAGSGFKSPNNRYKGMAPESDIAFVNIAYKNDTLDGSALGDYLVANPTIIDAYDYLFKLGVERNQPVVTNLSWGMHTGPHDGTSLFDLSVESLSNPGHVMVGAAGNDANNAMHVGWEGKSMQDTFYSIAIDRSRNSYLHENVYVDIWGQRMIVALSVQVALVDTFGNELVASEWNQVGDCLTCGLQAQTLVSGTDTLWLRWVEQYNSVSKKPNIWLMAESNNAKRQYIRIGFVGPTVHAWNSGQTYRWTSGGFLNGHKGTSFGTQYLKGTRSFTVGENGGSGRQTLSVGAYTARNEWISAYNGYKSQPWLKVGEIASFSSNGPMPVSVNDLSGQHRMKPDVSAPGQNIASALHRMQVPGWLKDPIVSLDSWNGQPVYYVLFSGTSMASPHAAGIVALYLQANPKLSVDDIRMVLRMSALRDTFTGTDSNAIYGLGKIQAYKGLKTVAQLAGWIEDFESLEYRAYADAEGNLRIKGPVGVCAVRMYNTAGTQVMYLADFKTSSTVSLTFLPSGLYPMEVIDDQGVHRFWMLWESDY
ncbi:MAG: hypothetical protein RL577_696 [Bacteroidota bacterium]